MSFTKLRGVNLGGWLVLERWITPGLFNSLKAEDEYSACLELGESRIDFFNKHREDFITEKDFKWLANNDLNAARLPVGYWLFGDSDVYVESAAYVDKALNWAQKHGLKVIIDLHAAPGSQNGWVHSGRIGKMSWHTNPQNISLTIDVIGRIAERWGKHPALFGIELLNEPHWDTGLDVLKDYYQKAYQKVRLHCPDKAVIISDGFRAPENWKDFINHPQFENMLLDTHLYQIFSAEDKRMSFNEHIIKTLQWKSMLEGFGPDKIIVGEWSRVLDKTYELMDAQSAQQAKKLYYQAQQYAFNACAGWFYWTYKTENKDDWSYRHLPTISVQ